MTLVMPLWAWAVVGGLAGWAMERWILALPRLVLAPYGDQVKAADWQGPGGGLMASPSLRRRCFLSCMNAWIWSMMSVWSPPAASTAVIWAWMACGSTLLILAMVDWNTTMLPDALVWPLACAGLLLSDLHGTRISVSDSLWSAVAWYAALSVLTWTYARIRGRIGMAPGDIKLMVAMASWWGWEPALWGLFTGSLLLPLMVWLVSRRGAHSTETLWPFGPSLVAGMLLWTQWQVGA